MPSVKDSSDQASPSQHLKPKFSNGHDSRYSSERKILRDDEASSRADVEGQEEDDGPEHSLGDANPEETVVPAGTVTSDGDVINDVGENVGRVSEGNLKDLAGSIVDQEGDVLDDEGNVIGHAEPVSEPSQSELPKSDLEGPFQIQQDGKILDVNEKPVLKLEDEADVEELAGREVKDVDEELNLVDKNGTILAKGVEISEKEKSQAIEESQATDESQEEKQELPDVSILEGKKINKAGNVVDENGNPIGRLVEGDAKKLIGKVCDAQGQIWNDSGKVLGRAEPLPELEKNEHAPFEDFPDAVVEKTGKVVFEGTEVGKVVEGDLAIMIGKKVDADGDILDKNGNTLGRAERIQEEEIVPEQTDYSILDGCKVNKLGNIVNEKGNVVGRLVEGDAKKLAGKPVDSEGKIYNDSGKVVGQAEPLEEAEEDDSGPFEDFPGSIVDKSGKVIFENRQVGVVIEGDISKLVGKTVDSDGDILDKNGNPIGKAERKDEEEIQEPEPEAIDYSEIAGCVVNKAGNVVNDKGIAVGRIVKGNPKVLIGRKVDKEGKIWNDSGKVIGQAEPLPDSERDESKEGPFQDFPDARVEKSGDVVFEGEVIGKVVDGDPKKLAGKEVDADGDIIDKHGNVVGKAERWEAPEEEPEPEVDLSILGGKRVNKLGNVVDSHGDIYGRVVEGDIKRLAGKMCDKTGCIRSEGGDIIGKAELVPDGEREGLKEGPFSNIPGCTVTRDGKVVDSSNTVIGRLIQGDGKVLYGKTVDDDGDVLDKNGNVIGKAERWEEPEEERDVNPMFNRRVNKQGEVVDENGDLIGKLTSGELTMCIGKKIDEDGDVVDGKGKPVGHVSLLSEIPEPEPEPEEEPEPQETEAERLVREKEEQEREQQEKDDKLAGSMAMCIETTLDKIQPILRMITESIESEERKPKEERDEESLVKKVRPLIEEGGQILTETNGAIRGMDPDGRIANGAKHKAGTQEASPAQYRLADKLKELTGGVTETINKAKAKIADMPHAKNELNPLWGLLAEPLGQILAAVGLLLSGVLGLVGKLLSGLGLGGLVDGLLGGLGLKKVLSGLGLGGIVGSLTGKK